jgi:surface antigen
MSTAHESAPAEQPYQPVDAAAEVSRFHDLALAGKRVVGRAALALGLATGMLAAEAAVVEPRPAMAETGGYPHADAKDCSAIFGVYSWCIDENKDGNYDQGEQWSPRLYDYNNCTDWAAFRAPQLTGKTVPDNLHDAQDWNTNAPDGWIIDTIPEPGDIAQSEETDPWGHVGVVEKVTKNTDGTIKSITVSEYNKAGTGVYSLLSYTPDSSGVFWRSPGKKWDHFLDLNGTGKGIDGEAISSGGGNDDKKQDIAWWTGSILNTRLNPSFSIAQSSEDMAPPDWAGVMDYNHDGLDDIVLFRASDGTLRVIEKTDTGWSPRTDNPVRGPGFGAAAWAGVGDFDGDGKKDDIAWWTAGGNLHKLTGNNFTSASVTSGLAAPQWADVIDYNNDGRDDILIYRPDGTLRVIMNSASGGWTSYSGNPVRTGVSAPAWAAIGDFNGDGNAKELAWWNTNNDVSILTGNNFALSSTTPNVAVPEWADVTDYDGDGKDDVVFYRQSDGTINILRKNPNGGFYLHTQNPIRGPGVSGPTWGQVGDFS